MTDLRDQLRDYFDEVDPAFDTASLMRERQSGPERRRSGTRSGVLVAAVAAVVVLIVVGLPLLLSGGQRETAVGLPMTTTVPTTSSEHAVPRSAASLLACLPLDVTGWSQSGPLPFFPLMDEVRLAANDDTVVAVGAGGPGDQLHAYWSKDGLEWQPAEGLPTVELSGNTPPSVAGGPKGFVAVGQDPSTSPQQTSPIVAYSEDGVMWEHIDPEALPHKKVGWLSDVVAGPAGFIILGASGDSFAWFSPDGRSWTDSLLPTYMVNLIAVVATESGWAAILDGPLGPGYGPDDGHCYDPHSEDWYDCLGGRARKYESSDGITWTATVMHNAPPDEQFGGYLRQSPQITVAGTWVLVNEFAEHGDATAWASTDAGTTWNEYPIGGEYASYEHEFFDIEAVPFGLLLAARHDFGATDSNFLHYSQDGGATWKHCQTPIAGGGTSELTQLAMRGDTLVMFDDYTGTVYVWNNPSPLP